MAHLYEILWEGTALAQGTRVLKEVQLQLSMQERAAIVPAEVLYHSRRDDAHHRVYVHRSEEAILVTDNHQVDRNFIQEEIFVQLQRSRMQYIHLGVFQISILARGYKAWQNSEANLLVTRGMVGRLSNTPNVGFVYEVRGVVDYLTSYGVNALPGRRFSTRNLQELNWVINPTQISIPMQPAEVNSQTMMDGRISLSFSNYTVAQPSEAPNYNNKDEVYEILAVLIETQPGVFMNYDGKAEEYYEENDEIPFDLELPPPSGWDDEEFNNPKQIEDTPSERYSSTTEPHILVNKISPCAVTPTRQTEGSVGLDISASHAAIIEPYGRDLIHTWLRIEIPYGYYGRLASRSSMAWKTGIEVGAGVIDSDYQGEVQILLFNRTNLPVYISQQQKIAQVILEKIVVPEVYEVPHLSHIERGSNGFRSTDLPINIPTQNQASTS
ncbi:hypothetical protein ZIOFF_008247 [Zingiber officinale]|uniref:dUTP diphosphatase n=1 Tax=Zingiber officinale TaxID=94328 RepID=A0A8J5IG20_ZINOF|nr:hypothetical protein ZIOFF_008247 [Zingiber officinale]